MNMKQTPLPQTSQVLAIFCTIRDNIIVPKCCPHCYYMSTYCPQHVVALDNILSERDCTKMKTVLTACRHYGVWRQYVRSLDAFDSIWTCQNDVNLEHDVDSMQVWACSAMCSGLSTALATLKMVAHHKMF
jgi:hypothetical protein